MDCAQRCTTPAPVLGGTDPPPTEASAIFVPIEIVHLYSDPFSLVFCSVLDRSVCVYVHMHRYMYAFKLAGTV